MQKKKSFTRWLPLIGLTFAVFVFNTSEFMPIGLTSSLKKYVFHNWLINNILYLCAT